jgi:hypothetical protein
MVVITAPPLGSLPELRLDGFQNRGCTGTGRPVESSGPVLKNRRAGRRVMTRAPVR